MVVFEIEYGLRECQALHLVICEAECRAHWNLLPSYRILLDFYRPLYWKYRNGLSFETFEGRVLRAFWLEQNACWGLSAQNIQVVNFEKLG